MPARYKSLVSEVISIRTYLLSNFEPGFTIGRAVAQATKKSKTWLKSIFGAWNVLVRDACRNLSAGIRVVLYLGMEILEGLYT
jgi:hypothetical protein